MPTSAELIESLRREAARATNGDESDCCFAPDWTCCSHKLLLDAANELERLNTPTDKSQK